MDYLLAIFAGAVQGLTEFLPISSTGHLIIFEHIFHISQEDFGLAFDASLHLGTLIAVLLIFKNDYLKMFNFKNKLTSKLIIGTIPAVILGLLFESAIDSSFRQLWIIGAALIIYSIVMVLAEKMAKQTKTKDETSIKDALIIGIFQAIALIPGVSRSGSTISAGLFLGLKREEAAKFAFMLSGPIIAGAGAKKFLETISNPTSFTNIDFFLIGIVSSAIFGYFTIKFLLMYLSTNTLYPFVVYRLILGTLLILLSVASN